MAARFIIAEAKHTLALLVQVTLSVLRELFLLSGLSGLLLGALLGHGLGVLLTTSRQHQKTSRKEIIRT